MQEHQTDYFISYTQADRKWGEWIAWQLEEAGYSVVLQAWDFYAGSNFILEMQKAATEAERTIAILSSDYINAFYTQPEWTAALVQDPTGTYGKLLLVRVRECQPTGLFAAIVYIDLVGLGIEVEARDKLLAGISRQRAKPHTSPLFPGRQGSQHTITEPLRFPGTLPELWNVPYQRNMFFTGRENILVQLHNTLATRNTASLTQPQAISGLGGIGKSQIAVEYAYRYHADYQAVLWVQADSIEVLIPDFVKLAALLDLPEKDVSDQTCIIDSVKRWLRTHTNWLLILDNVEDLDKLETYIPPGSGHVLLTTRTSVTEPLVQNIQLDKMRKEEGALFLLRRTNILPPNAELKDASKADHEKAEHIVEIMDGLPLALDQAGAYILETKCNFSRYLDLYQERRTELLHRRGRFPIGHIASVATTWSLSFEKVGQTNLTAVEIIKFCAFLYPDAIPEELLTIAISALEPPRLVNNPLSLDEAVGVLRTYSLVQRNPETSKLSMHRLVQEILKDAMSVEQQRKWVERTVYIINRIFPSGEPTTWPTCERYILQVQTCASLIEQWKITIPEAAKVLYRASRYLKERAQYSEAEPLLHQTLTILEYALGPNHPDIANALNSLAFLYKAQGKYAEAEPVYQRSLSIRAQALDPNYPDIAESFNNLAELYRAQGKYTEAEQMMLQALNINMQVFGSNHPSTAINFNNLAYFYINQEKYNKAEPFLRQALIVIEQAFGSSHPNTAISINSLAYFYKAQGKYDEAEPLYQRALAIDEQSLGPNHPNTVTIRKKYTVFLGKQRSDKHLLK